MEKMVLLIILSDDAREIRVGQSAYVRSAERHCIAIYIS